MKKLIYALTMALIWSSGARADQPSTHGMLLFGKQKTYASHLPMFHSPHDYQVLLELSFQDAGGGHTLAAYEDAKKTSTEYFTIVPELMDLTKIIDGTKTSFKAEIFKGHFERGGQNLGPVVVHVDKIIFSTKLKANSPSPGEYYLVFGEVGEYFAAHLIQGKPSFDAILNVDQVYPDSKLPLTVKGSGVLPQAGDEFGAFATVKAIHYLEQGDLAD